jgi:hypothetical protein
VLRVNGAYRGEGGRSCADASKVVAAYGNRLLQRLPGTERDTGGNAVGAPRTARFERRWI